MSRKLRSVAVGTLILAFISLSNGLDISYCSPVQNSGAYVGVYSEYMSNGYCQDQCQGSYVFAVIQGYYCWCSNYIPGDQQNTSECNQACPGYQSEWCGSTEAGLYAYFNLGGVALGTSGGVTATTTSSTTQSSSSTLVQSTTSSPQTSTSEAPAATSASTPMSTVVTTVLGSVKTILVTPTSSASADPTLGQGATSSGGVSKGKVVGIVLGVALGLGLIIGLGVFFWLRRKHANSMRGLSPDGSSYRETPADPNRIPSRQVSQMSSSNLLTRGGSVHTKSLNQSNTTRSADTASSAIDRRSLGTDQRLNPHALYIHDEGRYSNLSLQDNQDYSRQLRVANPDP